MINLFKAFQRFVKMWKGHLVFQEHFHISDPIKINVVNTVISAFRITQHTCDLSIIEFKEHQNLFVHILFWC